MVLSSIRNMFSSWWGSGSQKTQDALPVVSTVAQRTMPKEASTVPTVMTNKIVYIDDMDFVDVKIEVEPTLIQRTFAAGKETVFGHFKKDQPQEKSSAIVKKNLKTLGGQEVSLQTANGKNESYHYIKASDFGKSLNDAGAKPATVFAGGREIPAITFDGANNKAVLNAMIGLGICNGTSTSGMWHDIIVQNKIYYVPTSSKLEIDAGLNANEFTMESIRAETKTQGIVFEGKKTMVFSGGVIANKNGIRQNLEAIQYLLRGMDVVFFDDKGDGKTIDSESNVNAFARRDAIMRDLTKKRGIKNEDITIKGACYSAYHAALMAVDYPGTRLIIDQGYADMAQVAVDRDFGMEDSLFKTIATPFYENTMKVAGVEHHLNNDLLKAVKGPMCVLYNHNDEVVSEDQTIQVIDSIPRTASGMVIPIDNSAIEHAGLWSLDQEVTEAMEDFLDTYCGVSEKDYFFAQQR